MKSFKILVFILSLFCLVTSCNNEKEEIPYCNLTSFSSASGFIYVKVKYKNKCSIVVSPNDAFYADLNFHLFKGKLTESKYRKLVSKAIKNNSCIEINEGLYQVLKNFVVKEDLIRKYENEDILKKGYIRSDGFLQYNLDLDNQNAIVYILLKKKIKNFYNECESGRPVVAKD